MDDNPEDLEYLTTLDVEIESIDSEIQRSVKVRLHCEQLLVTVNLCIQRALILFQAPKAKGGIGTAKGQLFGESRKS